MFDRIVSNVSSHGNEYERAMATAYMTWEERCRGLFENERAEIVSSNYFRMCVVQKGLSYTILCFQRGRGFAI